MPKEMLIESTGYEGTVGGHAVLESLRKTLVTWMVRLTASGTASRPSFLCGNGLDQPTDPLNNVVAAEGMHWYGIL